MEKKLAKRKKISISEKVKMAKKELFEINATLKKIDMIVDQLPSDMEIDYLTERKAKINKFLRTALNIDVSVEDGEIKADVDSEGADVNVSDEDEKGEGGDDKGGEGDYLDFGDEGAEGGEENGEPEDVIKMNKMIERREAELRNLKRRKAMLVKSKK